MFQFGSAAEVPESTYVELVSSLFATQVPTAVMSCLFAVAGALICERVHDTLLMVLMVAGVASSAARILVVAREGQRLAESDHSATVAAQVERRFTFTYLLFAGVLGMFGARVLELSAPRLDMLATILLVGYAAGAAAGTALRPRISIASLLLAAMPAVFVLTLRHDPVSRMSAVAMVAFLGGGLRSLVERYGSQVLKTTRSNAFLLMAHRDHLTGLPNRHALVERFEELASEQRDVRLAVHCLDLDDFKPINDRHGHPAGDALLQAVATRLRASVRGDDFVARMGGDEFVFVQTGIKQGHEAAMMAMQLEQRLSEPYQHQGIQIIVGASVGYAVQTPGSIGLERLIEIGDEALLIRKLQRKQAVDVSSSRLLWPLENTAEAAHVLVRQLRQVSQFQAPCGA